MSDDHVNDEFPVVPPKKKVTRKDAKYVIQQEILRLITLLGRVSADDIHRVLEIPKDCMHIVPSAFRGLQQEGLIQKLKIVNSKRPDQHANRIAIWIKARKPKNTCARKKKPK